MKDAGAEIQLLQVRNLTMKLGRVATPSVVQLIAETIWGTPGGMRYRHFNTPEKIHRLHDPWFLYLEKDGEAMAALCLDRRPVDGLEAYYIRYFSFAEGLRRKGSEQAEGDVPASRGQGAFKRFSLGFFDKPAPLLEAAGTPKAIFYAYVEMENARSRDMVKQMGLSECGQFSTRVFTRLFPKRQKQVRRARKDEQAHLSAEVAKAYQGHAFYTDHGLFQGDNYFVLEENGAVVAGLQAHPIYWEVVEIPGLSGKFIMGTLPWIPLLSRLFNPRNFRFLAIEGMFCLPGKEYALQRLLEGVLAEMKMYTALIWMSRESPMHSTVKANVQMGILQRFKKDVPVTLVMRNYGYSPEELAVTQGKPIYVSAFDPT
jgi:hypothetical protein